MMKMNLPNMLCQKRALARPPFGFSGTESLYFDQFLENTLFLSNKEENCMYPHSKVKEIIMQKNIFIFNITDIEP